MTVGAPRPPSGLADGDPMLGRVISERYKVLAKLGEGGMGAVYLAEHVFIQKRVALKVLAPELARREELGARFLQEARAASSIGQENVIDISDFGQTSDGLVYFVMEYLEGVDLGAAIRRDGALSWPRAKHIVLQIGKALRAAHAQGIVHRDLKPENVFLIEREGRPDFVKLLDFGIAKVMGNAADEGPRLTRTGMIFGTPEYMAPEQAEGKDADHRVDIYAVGCVLHHCLTGAPPYTADSFMAVLTKHLTEPVVPPGARRPELGIPSSVDALVGRALQKNRDHRWQTMDELLAALAACETVTTGAVGGATRPLGSSAAAPADGMPVVRSERQGARTEVFDGAADADGHTRPAPGRGRGLRVALVVSGVLLGVAGAVLLAVRDDPAHPPEAAAGPAAPPPGSAAAAAPIPTPAPPATGQPAAAPAPGAPAAGQPPAPGPEPHRDRPRRSRPRPGAAAAVEQPDQPAQPATRPTPGPPPPIELKPFPQ
jgi:eukaryotic-like serine/threonine-protein kinase